MRFLEFVAPISIGADDSGAVREESPRGFDGRGGWREAGWAPLALLGGLGGNAGMDGGRRMRAATFGASFTHSVSDSNIPGRGAI